LLAEQAATIDLLSGGRLDFGIGKGYRHNEFAGFGIRMEDADQRFNECIEVLMKAWTSEARFTHEGKYWNFQNIVVEPPTAQRPHPPIWMGASSDTSIRSVAERGFNLLLDQFTSLEELKHRVALFKTEVEARGRTFDPMSIGIARAFYVADTKEDRDRSLQHRLEGRWKQLELAKAPSGDNSNWRFQSYDDTRANNEETAIYGSPDEIADKIQKLSDIGAGYLLLNGGGSGGGERGRKSLRRFAREVMPHFDKGQVEPHRALHLA
jgi:alkanesulfonate monooxygenase SsuD/methylene tetrahydromethanopterin reductase-like flavin-dependent oxidoreductase (luciferase family)